ncbi:MAG: hypothetical protein KME10_14350 [Plectolyngbya sp. WJT66-NPBG17]|jgi:hypothetical protein|nr:hypothetical protein [Plectolyngbya sp. WJT66-NPBG17]
MLHALTRSEEGKMREATRLLLAENLTNVAMYWNDEPVYIVEENLVT